MKNFISQIFIGFLVLLSGTMTAQQSVKIDISPSISKSIKGHKELQREKYFNLSANVDEIVKVVTEADQFDYYFNDLEMTMGRKLGLVNPEVKWGNAVREDANRPGYADLTYYKSQKSVNDNGMDELKSIFGDSQGLADHDNHNAYPTFMPQYFNEGANTTLPSNTKAAAELSSHILKYGYSDFKRPSYFELVNEPDWRYWDDTRFFDLHLDCKKAVDAIGVDTKVGGPCYSVSNFYDREFGNLSQFTKFIKGTNFELDFYSFHTYDYMGWNGSDFDGSITSGLPLESVFDALAAYTYNEYGTEFKYVGSEHGAYMSDSEERILAYKTIEDKYFAGGSGFDHEMKIRSIDNYIMVNGAIANTLVFMNHPHIVEKTVPFILVETSGWDPYYYSSLLVKKDFDKTSPEWVESRLIDYYRFFNDVKGRRVHSQCSDPDIQYHTFVDDNTLICVMKNQSNTGGTVGINILDYDKPVKSAMLRRLKRNADFTPSFEETAITDFSNIDFIGQEGMVLFVEFESQVTEKEEYIQNIYYSKDVAKQYTGTNLFTVKTTNYEQTVEATLRIGLSREEGKSKSIKVEFNDEVLSVPLENCADRITSGSYATTKIIDIPVDKLKSRNFIKITFSDGKSGGIGSVVLRTSETEVASQVKDLSEELDFSVYPNPTEDIITVEHQQSGTLLIYNIEGELVKMQNSMVGKTNMHLNGLSQGVYFVRLKSGAVTSEAKKITLL